MQLEFAEQPVVRVDGKGVLHKPVELGVQGGLTQPVRTEVYVFLHARQTPETLPPGVPPHEAVGDSVGFVPQGLAAHLAADVAVIGELQVDVDAHQSWSRIAASWPRMFQEHSRQRGSGVLANMLSRTR